MNIRVVIVLVSVLIGCGGGESAASEFRSPALVAVKSPDTSTTGHMDRDMSASSKHRLYLPLKPELVEMGKAVDE